MARIRKQVTMLVTVSVPAGCNARHARREVRSLITHQANFSLGHKDVVAIAVKPEAATSTCSPLSLFPFPEFEPPEELIELMAEAIHNNRGLTHADETDPFRPVLWSEAKADEYPVEAAYARDLARAAANALNQRFPNHQKP